MAQALWMLVFGLGCSTVTPADSETDEPVDGDTDTDLETGSDEYPLSGQLLDQDGAGVDATIRFCRQGMCSIAETEPDGSYLFSDVRPGTASFEVIPSDVTLAVTFVPIQTVTEPRTLDLTIPRYTHSATLTDEAVDAVVGEGLTLTVSRSNIVPPEFVEPATVVSGVRVMTDHFPPMDWPGELLALWYLAPFDHHSVDGIPFSIENDFGLAEGEDVEVWIGDYQGSDWDPLGRIQVTSGNLHDPSITLPAFSTLAVVRAAP